MSESIWLDARGVRLHAIAEGGGSPVLILHGFTGSTQSMAGVAAGLCDRWRSLRLDLVGHGQSDAPKEPGPYAMPRCVDQVAAALEALEAPRVHVIGYSMGGRVALALALAHPERVASLLLIGASAGLWDPRERADRRHADEQLARRIERDGVPAFVDAWMELPLFAGQRRLSAEALAASRAQRLSNRPHGLAGSLRGMGAGAQDPLHPRLGEVLAPVLLAVGDEDAKFRGIAAELARELPAARVRIIEAAGHAAHLENPDAFLRIAREFLAHVEASESSPRAASPTRSTRSHHRR